VGKTHGLPEGKVQALAGPKAWAWYPDQTTGTWRKATPEEVTARREKAAGKVHGVRGPKAMPEADRKALDAQIAALKAVDNPTLRPLLTSLYERQWADDAARKGSMKDRLATAIDKIGLAKAVEILEARTDIEETVTEIEKAVEEKAENV
jgi:hypothetical protein